MARIARRPRVLVVRNCDQFTHNLVQHVRQAGADCTVRHDQEASIEELAASQPEGVLLSPGPRRPADAGLVSFLGVEARASSPRKAELFEPPPPRGGSADLDGLVFHTSLLELIRAAPRIGRRHLRFEGLPFCPESILAQHGLELVQNWRNCS